MKRDAKFRELNKDLNTNFQETDSVFPVSMQENTQTFSSTYQGSYKPFKAHLAEDEMRMEAKFSETQVIGSGSGKDGEDGGYYVPSVDTLGNLKWKPSKASMPQVSSANIKGKDGYTPVVSISAIKGGHRISITDADGPKTADVINGSDGKNGSNGQDGKDGYTPVKGVDYFDGLPGKDGKDGSPGADGQPGKDGYSPVRGKDYWTPEDIQSMITDTVNGVLSQKSTILETAFPVGSEYAMSENKSPAEALGFGTWELVGKGFREEQGSGTTKLFTPNSTNTTSCTVYYRRSGNALWLKFTVKNKVALTDSTIALGSLQLAALGITAAANQTLHMMPFGSENGYAIMNLTTAGALSSVDVAIKNTGTSIAEESTLYGQYTLVYLAEQMLDDFCDKFYWKRTA